MILQFLLAFAAQASSSRLPPAEPLQAPGAEEQAILRPINALFAGIAARDPAAINAQLLPGGSATSVTEQPDGTRVTQRRPWAEVLARFQPGPEKFEERLTDPAIETDGRVAMVWGDYVFLIDGKVSHCGIDHFDLVRDNGAWKISDASWSARTAGCPAQ
jgi:hypothetical protein